MAEKEKIKITVDKVRAGRETQVLLNRSNMERSAAVKEAEEKLQKDPSNPTLWMEKGLALAKQMLYVEATEAFSIALSFDPFNWLALRHRGHRHLGIYRFAEAAADFELASRINQKDWDVWYHLGLSYYLLGDFERANAAYDRCLALTKEGDENLVAIVDWKWLTLTRLGRKEEADKVITLVNEDTVCGENQPYKDRVLAYQGKLDLDKALEFDNPEFAGLERATRGYGIAIYHYYNGNKAKAKEILDDIIKDDSYWSAFGYLAAYVELTEGRLAF